MGSGFATEAQKEAFDRGRESRHRRMKFAQAERIAAGKPRTKERDKYGALVLSRSQELERGIISVSQLDDEELAWRKCRNAAGTFDAPRFDHSPGVYAAMDQELLDRGARSVRGGYIKATETLVLLLNHHDARVQIQAIDRVMERVSGKVPDKLISADVTPHSEAQVEVAEAIAKALGYQVSFGPDSGDNGQPDIVDGEVVDEQREESPRATPAKPEPADGGRAATRRRKPKRQRGSEGTSSSVSGIDVAKYANAAPRKLRRT